MVRRFTDRRVLSLSDDIDSHVSSTEATPSSPSNIGVNGQVDPVLSPTHHSSGSRQEGVSVESSQSSRMYHGDGHSRAVAHQAHIHSDSLLSGSMGVDELMARARAVYDAARKASDDRHQPPSHHVTALSVLPIFKGKDRVDVKILHPFPWHRTHTLAWRQRDPSLLSS